VADLREELQRGLADRYAIERELGRGGFAIVCKLPPEPVSSSLIHRTPYHLKRHPNEQT
jgi:hypothetical protein